MSLLAAALLVSLVSGSTTLSDGEACDQVDEHGHPFATCFDPWQGLELGGAVVVDSSLLTDGVTESAHAALRLRGERESRSKAESTWLTLHRLGATELRPLGGKLDLVVLGYSGVLRRHVREGVLLLPFTPPVRVPFPLDLAFMADVLKFERRVADGYGTDWSLEPVRLSFLLDPLRSASNRFHLSLGVTAAWRVLQVDGAVLHEVTPLTAATLFFDLESEDGRWLARGTVSGGATLSPNAGDASLTFRARGELEFARVLLALNDQPLSVYLRVTGAWRDGGARGASELAAQAGVQIRFFSRR
jgi:hypothetical protein